MHAYHIVKSGDEAVRRTPFEEKKGTQGAEPKSHACLSFIHPAVAKHKLHIKPWLDSEDMEPILLREPAFQASCRVSVGLSPLPAPQDGAQRTHSEIKMKCCGCTMSHMRGELCQLQRPGVSQDSSYWAVVMPCGHSRRASQTPHPSPVTQKKKVLRKCLDQRKQNTMRVRFSCP